MWPRGRGDPTCDLRGRTHPRASRALPAGELCSPPAEGQGEGRSWRTLPEVLRPAGAEQGRSSRRVRVHPRRPHGDSGDLVPSSGSLGGFGGAACVGSGDCALCSVQPQPGAEPFPQHPRPKRTGAAPNPREGRALASLQVFLIGHLPRPSRSSPLPELGGPCPSAPDPYTSEMELRPSLCLVEVLKWKPRPRKKEGKKTFT